MNLRMSILAGFASLMSTILAGGEELRALREDYAAKAAVVESFQKLIVKRIEVEDVPIGDFLSALNRAVQEDKHPAVNFVVRMPRLNGEEKDPFLDEDVKPWKPRSVSIKAQAIDFATAVDEACQQAGFQWLIDIDRDTRVVALVISPDLNKPEGAGEWILAHLDRIVIPQVECEGASVEEVIDFARLRSIELDPESAKAPAGISFIICKPEDRKKDTGPGLIKEGDDPGARRIDYVAKNVTLSRLLIEIGRQAGLDVHVTDVGIILCAAGHPPFPNHKSKEGRIARTLYRVSKPMERESGVNGPEK